jgi:hypothetical protein
MRTMLDTGRRFVFLGSQKSLFKGPLPPHVSVCHDRSELEAVVTGPPRRVTWISFTRHFTDMLLEKAVDARADLRGSHLITLTTPRPESIAALLGLFHPVFGLVRVSDGFRKRSWSKSSRETTLPTASSAGAPIPGRRR